MQWDDRHYAGFSLPKAPDTWLPLSDNYRQVNVQRQLSRPDSLLNLYRQLLALRRSSPTLQTGNYQPLNQTADECYVYLRRLENHPTFLVVLNFSSKEISLAYPALPSGDMLLSTYLDRLGPVNLANLSLRANEGILVELSNSLKDEGDES